MSSRQFNGSNGLNSSSPTSGTGLTLNQMIIQSHDSLRGYDTDKGIPETWNDRPPLLTGPHQRPEDETLLKAVRV
jgi:hypothetical protein